MWSLTNITFLKVINAYEFERHAGCKTKHPNNHIYFESGKTIYGVVQELRSTPQNMLFEVLQTVTGSPINQKSFRSWKGNLSCSVTTVFLIDVDTFCWSKMFYLGKYFFLLTLGLSFSYTESFLAAARELQRICGKDEVKQLL